MKKSILSIFLLLLGFTALAQENLAFPFQGGKEIMTQFFKDSISVTPDIISKKATGTVIFKFTADQKGAIQKIIMYYADDAVLYPPLIDALKKTNHKWIVPGNEKFHDFIIQFSIMFNPPSTGGLLAQKAFYSFYRKRKPIMATDQVPLDMATMLPPVVVSYNLH